jgi:hypothetical protein
MESCDDDGIAILAAWERINRIAHGEFLRTSSRQAMRLDTMLSRDFVRFLEGRLRIHCPTRWQFALFNAQITSDGSTHFQDRARVSDDKEELAVKSQQVTFRSIEADGFSLIVHPTLPMAGEFGEISISRGVLETVLLTKEWLSDDFPELKVNIGEYADNHFTAIRLGSTVILADQSHGDAILYGYRVTKKDGFEHLEELLWKHEIDSLDCILSEGNENRCIEFLVRKNRLFVFHSRSSTIGIECLNLDTRETVFVFNSSVRWAPELVFGDLDFCGGKH